MVNRKPVATHVSANGAEDAGPIAITLVGSDADGTIASFRLNSRPKHGTLFLDAGMTIEATVNGVYDAIGNALTLYFRPNADFYGNVHFKYAAMDDFGALSKAAMAKINVVAVNDAPKPANVAVKGKEDSTFQMKLKGTDIDGKIASFRITDLPADGTLYLNKNGTGAVEVNDVIAAGKKLYFKPDSDWNGTTKFHYAAIDKQGAESINDASVTINISAVNEVPVTNGVSSNGVEDAAAIAVTLTGSDVDGTVASFRLNSRPKHGTLFLDSGLTVEANVNGVYKAVGNALTLYFRPHAEFNGNVSFKYTAIDDLGARSREAIAKINILAVNDAPKPTDVTVKGKEDSAVQIALKGTDVDGKIAWFRITDLPADGALYLNKNGTGVVAVNDLIAPGRKLYFKPNSDWNGTTEFHYAAIDKQGEESINDASVTINISSVNDAPTTKDASATGNILSPSIPITLTGDDSDGTVSAFRVQSLPKNGKLYLDADLTQPVKAGTIYPATAETLTFYFKPNDGFVGSVSFKVVAIDELGQKDQSSAVATLNVSADITPPDAPVIVSFTDDTGTIGDGLTADPTLTLTGTAEAGASIEIFNGAASLGTANADNSGQWAFTTATLADGVYNFTAKATDAAGNTSASSNVLTVTVDGTPPETPVIVSFSDDTGAPNDGLTADQSLTLTGTAEAGANIEIFNGAASLGTANANTFGQWIFTTATLTDGIYNFTAKATDAAANTSAASDALTVTVDATPPAAPLILSFDEDTGTLGDGLTADRTLALSGTAEAGTSVEIFNSANSIGTVVADGLGQWTFDTASLPDDVYTFSAIATDAAGNISASSNVLTVAVDATPPAAPVIGSFSDDTGAPNDGVTADQTLTLTGTAEAGASVEIFNGVASLGTANADNFGQWAFTTATLADGAYNFTAKATDAAGNTSASSNVLTVTVDATPPAAPVIVSFSDDTGAPGDGLTADRTLVLSGSAEAGASVEIFEGANSLGTANADNFGQWAFTTATLADGVYNFTAKATDAPANTSASSNVLTVTVDGTPPDAPILTSFTDDTGTIADGLTADRTLTLAGYVLAGTSVEVFDGTTSLGIVVADSLSTWSFDTGTLAYGVHNFTARTSDAAGNTASSDVLTVTVDPTEPDDAVNDAFTVTTFGSVSGDLGANDKRIYEGGILLSSYALTEGVPWAGPAHGNLILNPDGTFTYTPTGSIQGTDRFAYTITGPGGATSTAVVTITISPDNNPEIAKAMDFGESAAEIDFTVDSSGRPTGVDGIQFRFDLDDLTAFTTGDPADLTGRLQLFAPFAVLFTGIGSDGPVSLFDSNVPLGAFSPLPQTSAEIVGDEILVTIAPSYFAPSSTASGTFSFRFGYENYSVVNAQVGLGTDLPLNVVDPDFSTAFAKFSTSLNVIDDRGNNLPPAGDLLHGLDGEPGLLYLVNVPALGEVLTDEQTLIRFGEFALNPPAAILAFFRNNYGTIIENMTSPFAEYKHIDGAAGEDALASPSRSVTGGSGSDVIFGSEGIHAGHGGKGGNATDGGDGLIFELNPLTAVGLDGTRGGHGGAGGDGGSTSYTISGDAGDDTIIGGNGGNGGNGGARGSNGVPGENTVPSSLIFVTAEGGPGGTGGAGGAGGNAIYNIAGGDGNDIIYGGKGGSGGDFVGGGAAGEALYFIDGGDGDDTIFGGDGGQFSADGSSDYVITGGAGNDTIYGGAASGAGLYSLDGGDGDDFLRIERPTLDHNSIIYHFGTSLTDNSTASVAGSSATYGGAGDDTIELTYGLFKDLRVDGGDGFDTMIMRYPDKALPHRYAIDFDAGSSSAVPAIRDMIASIEHFVFDGETFGFDATMSAASIKAMTSTTSYLPPVGITIPSTSLMFVDGIGDATLTLSDAEDWRAAGEQMHFGEIYDVYVHYDENVFLLTHGFDDLL